jgi:hypothetical protein
MVRLRRVGDYKPERMEMVTPLTNNVSKRAD